ncbi:MAG: basic amino acid ABC transporter substrate-binding protein [Rickettsiales bacterium]|nr:MAG: basic amino acid ABC transporter substrate-binding protein [Rickettsiales bacterium]
MKKKLLLSVLVMIIATFSSANARKIIVGTNAVYAPLEFLDKDSKPTGFNTELITAILTKLGHEVEFIDMEFDGLIPSVETGKVDIIGSTFTIKPERKKKVDFTSSTLTGGIAIAYNKTKVSNVRAMKDLEGKKLGCEKGTTGCDMLHKVKKTDGDILIYDDTIALMMALETGKIDATISDTIVNLYYVKTNKDTNVVALTKQLDVEYYAFAVKKGTNKDLIVAINKTLKDFKNDGTYKNLQNKYGIK